jgi:alkylation response protein AidB-like acyl-CoA dehydrogenase
MPKGFKEAYRPVRRQRLERLSLRPEHGGQGLPHLVRGGAGDVEAANMAFSLCPLLTLGAIEALELCGSDAQKEMYLPNMVPANGPAP